MSYQWIRASEIGEYVYCNRAWWLKQVGGKKSAHVRQLKAGQHHHYQHGNQIRKITWMRKLAYLLIFIVVATVVFQLLIGMM